LYIDLHVVQKNELQFALPPYTEHNINHWVRQLWFQVTMSRLFYFRC